MSKSLITKAAAVAALSVVAVAGPASAYTNDTTVPGQQGRDGAVTGHYVTETALYAYNEAGQYVDEDGLPVPVRPNGLPVNWADVAVVADCEVTVNYRGDFGGDRYLDNGWITNQYKCEDGTRINYLFVHESDPRYTGNPEKAIWGSWEVVKETISGTGNIAAVKSPLYAPAILGLA